MAWTSIAMGSGTSSVDEKDAIFSYRNKKTLSATCRFQYGKFANNLFPILTLLVTVPKMGPYIKYDSLGQNGHF